MGRNGYPIVVRNLKLAPFVNGVARMPMFVNVRRIRQINEQLELWNTQRLADHGRSPRSKNETDNMDFPALTRFTP